MIRAFRLDSFSKELKGLRTVLLDVWNLRSTMRAATTDLESVLTTNTALWEWWQPEAWGSEW